jgi:hypothetical protein
MIDKYTTNRITHRDTMKFATIKDYIDNLIGSSHDATLRDFMKELHDRFYSNVDIGFMDDFLDIAKQENEGQFVIHHQKLIDYGVVVSGRSGDIKKRMDVLGLEKDTDYTLRDVSQRNSNGRGSTTSKVYMLTPDAFFLALQRAQRRQNQTKDPTIYAKYFLFLQKVVKYYDIYQIKKLEMQAMQDRSTICSLEKKLEQFHKESMEVLQETKQVATEARDETIKTRKTLDDAMDSMDAMHVDFVEASYHSTAVVQDGKKTNFALTSIVDDDGTVKFKTWRTQKDRMFDVLLYAIAFDGHELVIPPMYFAGATNVPIATANKLKLSLDTIAKAHNRTASGRKNKWSMTKLIKSTGLKLNSNPVWVPNPHISISDIVDAYLDVISDSQSRAFQLMDVPQDFEDTVKSRRIAYNNRVAKATGDTKKYLEDMAKTIQNAYVAYSKKAQ